jgi:hypothetical protein
MAQPEICLRTLPVVMLSSYFPGPDDAPWFLSRSALPMLPDR